MGNLQDYAGFDLDAFEEDDKEVAKASKSSEFMTLETGDNRVRFLPPPKDAAWALRPDGKLSSFKLIHEHFVEVPGLKKKVRFVCPKMHEGAFCPACSEADALVRGGNPFDRDKSRELYPSPRTYANVINRDDEAKGPVILSFSKTIREGLKRIGTRNGDFTDPSNRGFDIWITKSTKNGNTSYDLEADRNSSALGNDEWLDQQYNLDAYARVQTLAEIQKMLGVDTGRGGKSSSDRRVTSGSQQHKQLSSGRQEPTKPTARVTKSETDARPSRPSKRTASDDVYDVEFDESDELDDALAQDEDDIPM